MQCRTCQAELPQGATVCPFCQTPIPVAPAPSEYIAFPEMPPDAPDASPQGQVPYIPAEPQSPPIMPPPYPPYAPPMLYPPPQPRKKRKTKLIVTLSILGAVIILGSCGLICTFAFQGLQGFSRRVVVVQATVSTQATQSADALALYTEVTNRTPTFSNSLTSKGKGDWIDVGSDSTYSCGFKDSTYHVSISEKGYMANCYFRRFYMNFAIQVEANLLSGDYAGLLFRADSSGEQCYMFEYNQQGEYALYKQKGDGKQMDNLAWGMGAPYLNAKYGQKNVVTLIARDTSIYIYVNQHFLAQVKDETYSSGYIALLADDTDNPSEAAFSNLKIWEL